MIEAEPNGRNIFFFWAKENNFPQHYRHNIRCCAGLHRAWQTHLVDDSLAHRILVSIDPFWTDVYPQIRIPAARSDIARLALLYMYGGWYVDADLRVLRALDFFPKDRPVLFGRDDLFKMHPRITNMIMAAPKGSEMMLDALQIIRSYIETDCHMHDCMNFSGPGLVTALQFKHGVADSDLFSFEEHFQRGVPTFKATTETNTSTSWAITQKFGIMAGKGRRLGELPEEIDNRGAEIIAYFIRDTGDRGLWSELAKVRPAFTKNRLFKDAMAAG